jgi:hypothetical protein
LFFRNRFVNVPCEDSLTIRHAASLIIGVPLLIASRFTKQVPRYYE